MMVIDTIVVMLPMFTPILASVYLLIVGTFDDCINRATFLKKYMRIAQQDPVVTLLVIVVYALLCKAAFSALRP